PSSNTSPLSTLSLHDALPIYEGVRFVEEADIPTATAVHALARAAAERSGVWWRELQILLVAYSGMRWGEMAALTADRVDGTRRRDRKSTRLNSSHVSISYAVF